MTTIRTKAELDALRDTVVNRALDRITEVVPTVGPVEASAFIKRSLSLAWMDGFVEGGKHALAVHKQLGSVKP